jgi:hypothetical protein
MRVPLDLAETTHTPHDAQNILSHRFIPHPRHPSIKHQNQKICTEEKKLIRRSTLPLRYQHSIAPIGQTTMKAGRSDEGMDGLGMAHKYKYHAEPHNFSIHLSNVIVVAICMYGTRVIFPHAACWAPRVNRAPVIALTSQKNDHNAPHKSPSPVCGMWDWLRTTGLELACVMACIHRTY